MTEPTNPLSQVADELKVQAWLARAEFKNPSLNDPAARKQVDVLAQTRDELRLQMHLGELEAKEEWAQLETRWHELQKVAAEAADEMAAKAKDLMSQIKDGYDRLIKD